MQQKGSEFNPSMRSNTYSNMLDKDKIKESLATDDITLIMTELGSAAPKQDRDGNPIYTTVCHGGSENSHKLYYYKDSYHFHCYTNCGGGKDIYQIVLESKAVQGFDFTFPDAVKWVAKKTGKQIFSSVDLDKTSDKIDDWNWIQHVTKKKPVMDKELPVHSEHVLDVFMSYRNNWVEENIDVDTAKKFEVGFYFTEQQITIPHRDSEGRLIGIRSRNTDERADRGMKYIPTTVSGKLYNHLTMYNCYGMHISKEAIKRHKRVYIFEGEKSCMKSEFYYKNDNFSIAVSGSNVSDWQVKKILSLGVEDVILAFDKFREQKERESDEVYERFYNDYKKKLARIGHKFAPYTRFHVLWDEEDLIRPKDSPIDRGKEVFELMTENKIEIHTKDVVF